jgi:hypothetical protein
MRSQNFCFVNNLVLLFTNIVTATLPHLFVEVVSKTDNSEVIHTVYHDSKSSLLLPTLTKLIQIIYTLVRRVSVYSNAPSSGTTGLMRHSIVPYDSALECTKKHCIKI